MITTVMQNQSRQSPCLIALSRHKKEFKILESQMAKQQEYLMYHSFNNSKHNKQIAHER
jgi:hypothetical protein